MLQKKLAIAGILALTLFSSQKAFAGDYSGNTVFTLPQSSLVPQGSWVQAPKYTPPAVITTNTNGSNSTNLPGPGIFSFGSPAMTPVLNVVPAVPYLGGIRGVGLGLPYYGSIGSGYGGWGGYGGFGSGYGAFGSGWGTGIGGFGSGWGTGLGGFISPMMSPGGYGMMRTHHANQKLGTLSEGPVMQSAPSKASGNYYSPSSTDSSSSGSYYASDTPSYVPAPKPYSTGDNFWGGSSAGSSSPFPKDLNKTPW
ncbi:MAG: hypothetical protein SFY67_03125 [Candidatus Melainabacteria bacterium]|nr:hypothetical protein [Candidatus Melainabacteria bacterium]